MPAVPPEPQPLILVVEDDAGAATLQKRRLERSGFRVVGAASVTEAIAMLATDRIDLVVMDYRLGGTTGLDLHRQMKVAGFDVPVIMVTGTTDDAVVVEAMRAGIRDFVVKTTDYLDYLPEAARGIINQTAVAPDRSIGDLHGVRILIVEDDEGTAELERRLLERSGYHVAVAHTAADALRAVHAGDVDLMLLDLRLDGGASGLELYESLHAEGFGVPTIVVTGFPDELVAIRALRAGIRDFVPKSSEYLEYLPRAVDRVAEQVRIERRLVVSELRLASIVGTTMDAIVMCDEKLKIVLFNRSAEEMFGVSARDALGEPIGRFMPGLEPGGRAERHEAGERVRERVELDAVGPHGRQIPIEVSVSEVLVHRKRFFTVIARDISERRQSEAELREADRRKDEFLGMLAHELRNPLAAITNAAEVLDRTLDDARALKLTAVVKRQAQALGRMVDDLLEVSRITLGKIRLSKEPLLLSQVVARAAEGIRDTMTRNGQLFDVQIQPDPVWLDADALRLEQVMSNLLSNAAKFTPAGGRIQITGARENGAAVIRVRDSGIGMEPALVPKVFDLFVQADTSLARTQSGLGIGLALVRQIVTLHGGQVSAFSAGLGEGSEFVVRLPALPDERPATRGERRADTPDRRRLHVLVVDDQPDMADCVALLIETMGHRASAVYDGASAVEASRRETPDLMFVDIGMPVMNGYDVARQIRSVPELAGMRLVALTGYGRDEDRTRALEAGFDLHLTKPVTDETLRAVLVEFAPRAAGGS